MRGSRSVVVVGSGAAGLAAALAAAGSGADVLVVESAPSVGGTTAMSGGVVWMPGHGRPGGPTGRDASGAPAGDDAAEALAYLQAASSTELDVGLVRTFLSDTRRVADEIESRTPIEWEVLAHWPDYRGELPGARPGGRSLWPRPLALRLDAEQRVQAAFDQPPPGDDTPPNDATPANDGVVLRGHVRGRALAGGLLAAVLDARVEVRTGARADAVALDAGRVVGVVIDGQLEAGSVVLACGGFQHDGGLVDAYLPGAPVAPMGPRGCGGDGLRMARSVDAVLGNMDEGWWMPALRVPGEAVDGTVHYRPLHSERAQPGSILVDRTGKRFVDEAQNYGDVGRAMRGAQPGGGRRRVDRGAPWWLVFDAAYRSRYPVGPLVPGDADPPWLCRAADVAALADLLGVPGCALEETVAGFNAGAGRGDDPEFGRGSRPYDRWIGDARAEHPTLAALEEPPFYAVEVHLGCMGTKGGPRTDDSGRVLSSSGVVAGLYAAGNAAASPFGTATAAGGATLGPALVFGYRAGEAAVADR